MKTSIVVLTLCIASVLSAEMTEEQKKKLQPHKDACLAATGVDAAVINEAEMKHEYPADGSLNCYSACMFKRLEFVTAEGEFDEDVVRAVMSQNFPEDKINAAFANCKDEHGKDGCETAGKVITCFMKNGIALN